MSTKETQIQLVLSVALVSTVDRLNLSEAPEKLTAVEYVTENPVEKKSTALFVEDPYLRGKINVPAVVHAPTKTVWV